MILTRVLLKNSNRTIAADVAAGTGCAKLIGTCTYHTKHAWICNDVCPTFCCRW